MLLNRKFINLMATVVAAASVAFVIGHPPVPASAPTDAISFLGTAALQPAVASTGDTGSFTFVTTGATDSASRGSAGEAGGVSHIFSGPSGPYVPLVAGVVVVIALLAISWQQRGNVFCGTGIGPRRRSVVINSFPRQARSSRHVGTLASCVAA